MQPVQRGSSRPQLGNVKLEVLLTCELPCCIGSGIYISLKFRAEVQAQRIVGVLMTFKAMGLGEITNEVIIDFFNALDVRPRRL